MFLLSIVLFSSLPLSTFAAQTVYVDYYYAPWRDEYRADHTGLGAGEFYYFTTHFTAADTTEYTLDLNYYTGIMYLTCNGVYKFQFVDEFDNVDPDKVNESLGLTDRKTTNSTSTIKKGDISSIDRNGDGQITIKEAKAAGFKMPITRDHWLYPYMDDRDNDGMVGE